MSLVILVPMLGRPHTVAPLLASIRDATPDAQVLFALTPDDDAVIQAVVEAVGNDVGPSDFYGVDREPRGDYARKINVGIRHTTEDHIFTGACDLKFRPGWYEAAVARLTEGIGVVGTNDLSPRAAATHFLVTRSYVEQFGTIDEPGKFFHEGYPHEWVDDEAIGTAQYRKAYAYADDSIVEHMHPAWGKADWDDTYRRMGQRMRDGQTLFNRRRSLWT